MSAQFDPKRLTLARRLKELTKKDLADVAQVSAASITQYEAGRTVPPGDVQARLALACGVPQAYLHRSEDRQRPDFATQSFFRSLRSTSQAERDRADAMAQHVSDIANALDRVVRLPPADAPSIRPANGTRVEIEEIARRVRTAWSMPDGPIANMTRLLESRGVVVARLQSPSPQSKLDGFSRWFGDRPIIVLWADKSDKARSRFDAAHELGHIVMHSDAEPTLPEQERQANFFASAFLMPYPEINSDLIRATPTAKTWNDVLEKRAHWGVSAKALLYRSRELGALPELAYRRAMQNYNRFGLGSRDGNQLGAPEGVKLLGAAALAAEFSARDIAGLTHLGEGFVCEVLDWEYEQPTHETNVIVLGGRSATET